MDLNEQECGSSGKLKSTSLQENFLPGIGRMSLNTEILDSLTGQQLPLLMCSAEASRVKTSALLVRELGLMGTAQGCGVNTSDPFAHFDHATLSWKTYQVCFLTSTWGEYLETWPRAGMMRNGQCCQRVPWVRHIHESACSYWPTPRAVLGNNTRWSYRKDYKGNLEEWAGRYQPGIVGQFISLDWLEWLMGYPIGWTALEG